MTEEIKQDLEAGLNTPSDNGFNNENVEETQEETTLPVSQTVDKSIDVKSEDLGYDIQPEKPIVTGDAVLDKVSERLGQATQTTQNTESTPVAEPQQTMPFDLSKLTTEQIQQLQQMLAVTPQSVKKRVIKPITQIREINGKYVIDATKSFMRLKRNSIENRDELTHFIGVKFYGDAEFTEMGYSQLIEAPRVKCEIISTRYEDGSYIEGEPVVHRETGHLTEREVKITIPFYTIKLPTGDTVEIKGSMSNF